jgi:hypothetical protein
VRTWAGRALNVSSTVAVGFLGLVHRGVDPEDLGQPGDAEDLQDALLCADELQGAVVRAHALQPANQDAEPGRVQEVHLLHVHEQVEVTLVDQIDQELTQPRRSVHIDLTLDLDDGEATLGAMVQLQIHRSSSALPAE